MKKIIWTEDQEVIKQEIDAIARNKTELVCGRLGRKVPKKLATVGKTVTKGGLVFVVYHPHEPSCASETCTFYYHGGNKQLRFFECKRMKKAENYVGYECPKQIYLVHRRKYERVLPPQDSPVTFSFKMKQRLYHGTIGDISSHGAKLLVNIPMEIAEDTTLCHITMTLFYRVSKTKTAIVVGEAKVIWSACANSVTHMIGVKFLATDDETALLSNYVELRLIEESTSQLAEVKPVAESKPAPAQETTTPSFDISPDEEIPEF